MSLGLRTSRRKPKSIVAAGRPNPTSATARGAGVVLFADAVRKFALALSDSAKVKTQRGQTELHGGLGGAEYNLVVHRSTEGGMGMAHQSRERRARARLPFEQGFKHSDRTGNLGFIDFQKSSRPFPCLPGRANSSLPHRPKQIV